MDDFVSTHETAIRSGFFFGIFLLMAVWELLAQSKGHRWLNNIGLVVLNTLLLRLLFPVATG